MGALAVEGGFMIRLPWTLIDLDAMTRLNAFTNPINFMVNVFFTKFTLFYGNICFMTLDWRIVNTGF
jgi:hypothetical protein